MSPSIASLPPVERTNYKHRAEANEEAIHCSHSTAIEVDLDYCNILVLCLNSNTTTIVLN